jgi:hypothetical protein
MMTIARVALATLFVCCASVNAAGASTILIDFEHFPGPDLTLGTPDDVPTPNTAPLMSSVLSNQYSSVGVTFLDQALLQGSFFDGNPLNHFLSFSSVRGQFSVPVTTISFQSRTFWSMGLTAFDASNNVIGFTDLVNPNAGTAFLDGILTLTVATPIHHFIAATLPAPGGGGAFPNLDNMSFGTQQPAAVPEPAAIVSVATGMVALAALRRTYRRH